MTTRKVPIEILRQIGGIDLRAFKRLGVGQTLWEEIQAIQRRRNAVVHRGAAASESEAQHAQDVAAALVNTIVPNVLSSLGLNVDDQLVVSVP